jgi:hypothetical protein
MANRRMVYFAKHVKTKDTIQNIQDNVGMSVEMGSSEKKLKMTQGGWSF